MYKLYTIIIATPLFMLITVIIGILVTITSLLGMKPLSHRYIPMLWGRSACWLYLLPVHVEGREKLDVRQSYVFVANHQGYLDILLMYGYLGHTFKWMMKDYLKKMPIVGQVCMVSHQIFVGDSLSSIQQAVKDARKTLQGGMSMSIFPEGTRTYDGTMGPFKRGAFMLANEIGLPIVPITINGSFKAFSRKAKSVTRTPLSIQIHEPITPDYYQQKPTKVFMQEVHDRIECALGRTEVRPKEYCSAP